MKRALALCFALMALAACGRPANMQRDHIKFSHGPHLRRGLSCTTCHTGASAQSASSRTGDGGVTDMDAATPEMDRWAGLPSEQQCRSCHSRADHPEEQRCDYCHTAPQAPMPFERVNRELYFSHANHAPRVRGNCMVCHGVGADTRTETTFEPRVPNMAACATRCHGADMRALNCTKCHQSLRRFAIDEVSTPRHEPGYARHHGAEARAMTNACSQCHEPTFCSRCHTGAPGLPVADLDPLMVTRDFVHRGDFMARHPDEARFNTINCTRCHGVEFCDGCHHASGIGGGVGPGNTHPPGWLNPASPNGHAREARRNLLTCVACHESDAVQVCVPCHRSGGGAGSPHPPNFTAGISRTEHSVCIVCHGGA